MNREIHHHRLRHQTSGGCIMLWACLILGILGRRGKWLLAEKKASNVHIDFLQEQFETWLTKQKATFKRTILFLQGNDPSQPTQETTGFLNKRGFCRLQKDEMSCKFIELKTNRKYMNHYKVAVHGIWNKLKSIGMLWEELVEVSKLILNRMLKNYRSHERTTSSCYF